MAVRLIPIRCAAATTPLAVTMSACACLGALGQTPPAGYYATADGKTGAALKAALHDIIDDHTVVAYSWAPLLDIDEAASDVEQVELVYSDGTRAKRRNGGGGGEWNREHLWPKSYGIADDGGADNSDLFNIRPCDVQVNSERGSLAFDDTEPGGGPALSIDAPGCSRDGDSWEPRDDEKGDIARACFYMDVRYDGSDPDTADLELGDAPDRTRARFGTLRTLLRWHRLDPPDDRERARNAAIFSRWQGNRNPFIDRPEFAEMIYCERYPELDDEDGTGAPVRCGSRPFGCATPARPRMAASPPPSRWAGHLPSRRTIGAAPGSRPHAPAPSTRNSSPAGRRSMPAMNGGRPTADPAGAISVRRGRDRGARSIPDTRTRGTRPPPPFFMATPQVAGSRRPCRLGRGDLWDCPPRNPRIIFGV